MKLKFVGSYHLGNEWVDLFLRDGTGAEFICAPAQKGKASRIIMGIDSSWTILVGNLLHEAMEFIYSRFGCRFENVDTLGRDLAAFLFLANHAQFTDACAKVGEFVIECLPDFEKAWKKATEGAK